MKDYLCGLYTGVSMFFGIALWCVNERVLGMCILLSGWFVGVVVWGHYQRKKNGV